MGLENQIYGALGLEGCANHLLFCAWNLVMALPYYFSRLQSCCRALNLNQFTGALEIDAFHARNASSVVSCMGHRYLLFDYLKCHYVDLFLDM
jgi:hypothetical protein